MSFRKREILPETTKPPRRTVQIDEDQAEILRGYKEYKRLKMAGTLRLLLDEAIAAREEQPMSFSVTYLNEHLGDLENKHLAQIMKSIAEILDERL